MKNIITSAFLACIVLIGLFGCKTTRSDESFGSSEIRLKLLKNIGRNIILPEYAKLKVKTDSVLTVARIFNNNVSEANLILLQNTWDNAYSQYMRCNAFNFGPGRDALDKPLLDQISLFPVSYIAIEKKIDAENYTTLDFAKDTRGFLALDYLLFDSLQDNGSTVTKFANKKRQIYLDTIATHLKNTIDKLNKDWVTYITIFENDVTTSSSGNMARFYNEFVYNYEVAKNFKVQLPAGLRANQNGSNVRLLEAYYSGKSLKYLKLQLEQVNRIWEGIGQDPNNTIGFDDYLAEIPGGNQLTIDTRNSWLKVQEALAAIPTDKTLANTINSNFVLINELNSRLVGHTKFYKSELQSKIGIAIDYVTGDGD